MRERDIQKSCLDYLRLKGWFAWKNSSVGIYRKDTGHYIPSSNAGSPDILAIKQGQFIGVECKAKYGKLSPKQSEWQQTFKEQGIPYFVVRSLDELIKQL